MDMVSRLCGRVVVMAGGRFLTEGRAGRRGARPRRRRRLSRRRAHDAPTSPHRARPRRRSSPATSATCRSCAASTSRCAQGELVVVLGPNGAGKSTFVKAIAGLVPIHSGTASLGDIDITARARASRRSATASPSCRRPRTSSPRCRSTTICCSPRTSCRRTERERAHRRALRHVPRPRGAAVAAAGAALRRPAADAGGGARADRRAVAC